MDFKVWALLLELYDLYHNPLEGPTGRRFSEVLSALMLELVEEYGDEYGDLCQGSDFRETVFQAAPLHVLCGGPTKWWFWGAGVFNGSPP